ncbi:MULTISPECIES: secretion protein F [unclassified Clostridioides]|uniref:type II secretion system F family protein n=1 Tax=unclassified Clostridioides TaxID=2635829 RepID=UPI001C1C96EE|nr:secretion protein F [Clostridioides difficile]MCC0732130.1 secretion protein F [Clostridioides sp. ZZV14-6048]MCC0739980.1 secretion protein F [Clostridioides sp. ZZV14-5902]MCL6901977.1 secretion protein F [Clostridioides difficile]MCP3377843.1 secretion protein F [Clostridioides difficile]
MIIIIIISIFLGIYLILADILNIPKYSYSKVIVTTLKINKSKRSINNIALELAIKISKFIKISENKKNILDNALKSAGIKLTPQTYIANAIANAILVLIFTLPLLIVSRQFYLLGILLAIYTLRKEIKKVDIILKKRKDEIEYELPEFVRVIAQELKTSRDIIYILNEYKENTSGYFREELEITLADMTSGSNIEALKRFDSRVGSSYLSEAIRGLIGIFRGNDSEDEVKYFERLSSKLDKLQIQKLEALANIIPEKIGKYSYTMFLCFVLNIFIIIITSIVNSISKIF